MRAAVAGSIFLVPKRSFSFSGPAVAADPSKNPTPVGYTFTLPQARPSKILIYLLARLLHLSSAGPWAAKHIMTETTQFAGATKQNTSFLTPLERRLAVRVLPRIPTWLETYHLTMLTLVWSGLILFFSYLARNDLRWLWGVSAMVAMQYVTDHYDGKIGKYRGTGLVRWGYYMDHLLDYFFLCSVIIGYSFILPERSRFQILIMLAIFAGYEVSTFLAFAATERLKISYLKFGPTEFRLALIVINVLLVQFGTREMVNGLKYVNIGAAIGLAFVIYRTHKVIWTLDMEHKNRVVTD
jgi:archaetidylinositol phosphate synthase